MVALVGTVSVTWGGTSGAGTTLMETGGDTVAAPESSVATAVSVWTPAGRPRQG